jgi:hypothetical protein
MAGVAAAGVDVNVNVGNSHPRPVLVEQRPVVVEQRPVVVEHEKVVVKDGRHHHGKHKGWKKQMEKERKHGRD